MRSHLYRRVFGFFRLMQVEAEALVGRHGSVSYCLR